MSERNIVGLFVRLLSALAISYGLYDFMFAALVAVGVYDSTPGKTAYDFLRGGASMTVFGVLLLVLADRMAFLLDLTRVRPDRAASIADAAMRPVEWVDQRSVAELFIKLMAILLGLYGLLELFVAILEALRLYQSSTGKTAATFLKSGLISLVFASAVSRYADRIAQMAYPRTARPPDPRREDRTD